MYSLNVIFHIAVLIASELQCAKSQSQSLYGTTQYEDYCPNKNTCFRPNRHLVCQLQTHTVDDTVVLYEDFKLTAELAEKLLRILNQLRSEAATGNATGLNKVLLPRGYGILRLQWDRELAGIAKLYTDKCLAILEIAECAATKRFPEAREISFTWIKDSEWKVKPTPKKTFKELSIMIEEKRNNPSSTPDNVKRSPDLSFFAPFTDSYSDLTAEEDTYEPGSRTPTLRRPESSNDYRYLILLHGAASHIGCSLARYKAPKFYLGPLVYLFPRNPFLQNEFTRINE